MPIHCPITFQLQSNEEYDALDRKVLGHAYACHNELGKLYDESIYESDIALRLRTGGFQEVHTQVPITVSHRDFVKLYRLDLVVDRSAVYDLKAAAAFLPEHEAMMLNYILLVGLPRGKLLNFRGAKVRGQLVASRLRLEDRQQFICDRSRWHELAPECEKLRQTFLSIIADWGAYLEIPLYQAALTHFFGGEERVILRKVVTRNGLCLGTQRFHLHAADIAFRITAFTQDLASHEMHLKALCRHTGLRGLQWINLNHSLITFVTIIRH
jgi:GxxExxY protein